MLEHASEKLSDDQVNALMARLVQTGHSKVATALSAYITALREELAFVYQYYEEFFIPELLGLPSGQKVIGQPFATEGDRPSAKDDQRQLRLTNGKLVPARQAYVIWDFLAAMQLR